MSTSKAEEAPPAKPEMKKALSQEAKRKQELRKQGSASAGDNFKAFMRNSKKIDKNKRKRKKPSPRT